ncbi:hypothetical protein CAPTEDRAFT_220214 [Capitella teleta]|uniref:Glycosyltransferase family 92 protein n=1 Tax=Capitella teleta TaxID=283909 RepID=R7TC41_CAPTE|nr:hypothetical protein CAPTEDRAFT_220214 [Capitella teleta]|eukprot:ELT88661.1 hypothetical protein CAPTEDRAFT_220214 [Capitella teleta]
MVKRRNALLLVFATSSALFCLQNIYHSGIIQSHFADFDLPITDHVRMVGRIALHNHSININRSAAAAPSAVQASLSGRRDKTASAANEARGALKGAAGKGIYTPLWQRRVQNGELGGNGTYFLAELLQVRIYAEDKAKWTLKELKQWMHYIFLAGVQHIYLCDHYKYEHERLDVPLSRYINLGLVTYYPWSSTRHPMTAQIRCYQKMIDDFKHKHTWQIAVDMDEYPYSPIDTREDFLVRYLHNTSASYPNPVALTEISMNNYLMLGQGDRTKDLVIERINRMTPKPANILVKPIYKPSRVRANIHHNILKGGRSVSARDSELRMLHYWGARTQDWGPDNAKTLAITQPMTRMVEKWASQVRNSLLAFGETDAFSRESGP